MWEGFEEQIKDEVAAKGVRQGMERHLVDLRENLGDMREDQVARRISEYEAPEIVLV